MRIINKDLLTDKQMILLELAEKKELSNTELAESLNIPQSSLSDILQDLFIDGFITYYVKGKYKIWKISDEQALVMLKDALINYKNIMIEVRKIILKNQLKKLEEIK